MKIAIAAESLRQGDGLAHFLRSALIALAAAAPDWEFHVVARAEFVATCPELVADAHFIFHVWDQTPTVAWLRSHVRVRGRERTLRLLAQHLPLARWRRRLGNLDAIWAALPPFDA